MTNTDDEQVDRK